MADQTIPRHLVLALLALVLVVMGLGGAVLAVKLRPAPPPATAAERDIGVLEEQVKRNPKDDWARAFLGSALVRAGRKEEAKAAFEEALRLNPKNPLACFELALLIKGSDPARAEELLRTAAENAPRTQKAAPYIALGDLLMEKGDAASARDAYEKAVADAPFLLDAHLGLAKALEALGEKGRALEEYRSALRFDPGNEEIKKAIARLEKAG